MDILMPQLGETVTEGTVTVWRKKVGEHVKANEVLFEVSTDKVETEVPAPADGVLSEITVAEGVTVDVGTTLGVLAEEGGAVAESSGMPTARIDVVMPQLGETVNEGTVTVWHKKVGDTVAADEILFEVSTDKVETEVPSPAAGVLAEISVAEGATVDVGTTIAILAAEGNGAKVATAKPTSENAPMAVARAPAARSVRPERLDPRGQPLSPVVRRLLAEHGINAGAISGTGRDGRITRRDVLAAVGSASAAGPSTPALSAEGEVIPLSRIRKQIGDHMVRSKATSPHVLQAVEADFHAVEKARASLGDAWRAKEGYGLTFLPFIARATIEAIAEFPRINASIEGDNLVVHGAVNLGIAVDLGFEGLMVPVIKDAQNLSVADLARAIRRVATGARDGKLGADDYAGGTYTLSNSGPFGTLITAPVINQPQVAILSTDGVRKKPVVIEGEDGDSIAIRPVGVLAQSFDHRAFDGAYSAAFLNRLREILEQTDWSATLG
jgi:2-oxoglutarate dehydrogenase E2 component (dihydrolipoamide succinyltransferase)